MTFRLYANRHPRRQQQDPKTEQNSVQRQRNTGRVNLTYEDRGQERLQGVSNTNYRVVSVTKAVTAPSCILSSLFHSCL